MKPVLELNREQQCEHIGAAKTLARLGGEMVSQSDSAGRMFSAARVLKAAADHAGIAATLLAESEREMDGAHEAGRTER